MQALRGGPCRLWLSISNQDQQESNQHRKTAALHDAGDAAPVPAARIRVPAPKPCARGKIYRSREIFTAWTTQGE
jgi:hypothetical protein